jgi:hypothetical protein
MRWQISVGYVPDASTGWAVNANGNTYGVANENGSPDLTAVVATNGRTGYVYTNDLNGPLPTSPAEALAQQEANEGKTRVFPVYKSDGETKVGEFEVG